MNRVIKFRAFINGKMLPIAILHNTPHPARVLDMDFSTNNVNATLMPKETSVMQFTGLYDKNGNEIYEGDIVKAAFMHHGNPGIEFTAYIIYNEHIGSFRIAYNSLGGGSQDEIYFRYQVEVIGNIHENPELLKQTK